jgi:hypothetical protein
MVEDLKKQLEKKTKKKIYPISAPIWEGIEELQNALIKYIPKEEVPVAPDNVVIDLRQNSDPNDFKIVDEWNHHYRVIGERIEQIVRMTSMKNEEAVDRVWDVMWKRKITNEIEKLVMKNLVAAQDEQRIKNSDIWYTVEWKILIGDAVFQFRDYR